MSSLASSTAAAVDQRTLSVIANLKGQGSHWDALVKACLKFSAALREVSTAAQIFEKALNNIGQLASATQDGESDLGTCIHQIADAEMFIEKQREVVIQSLLKDLIEPIQAKIEPDQDLIRKIEKEYKSECKRLSKELHAAESAAHKAGKKKKADLSQLMQDVSDKIKDIETTRQNYLRKVLLEERKRYCFVIMHLNQFVGKQVRMHEGALGKLQDGLKDWYSLAVTPDELPPECEKLVTSALVTSKERTFLQIDNVSISGVSENDEFDEWDEHDDHKIRASSLPPPALSDNRTRYKVLYDFESDDADRLRVKEGQVVFVKDPPSGGWIWGELNGRSGYFPESYAEIVPTSLPSSPLLKAPAVQAPNFCTLPRGATTQPFMQESPAQNFSAPAPPPAPAIGFSAPAPPPAPAFGGGGGGGGGGDAGRSGLLSSIHAGAKLKKTVTNDRSGAKL